MTVRAFARIGIVSVALLAAWTLAAVGQSVSVDADPFRINLQLDDNTRSVIGAPPRANEAAAFGLYFSGVWERVLSAEPVEGSPGVYNAMTERGTPLRITVDAGETVSTVTLEGPPDIDRIGYGFVPSGDEQFYTYVRNSAVLDRRGTQVDSRRDSSAVPLALSSRGYGVYVPTEGDFGLDFGSTVDLFTFWADGSSVTFYFYTDPDPAEIVERFTEQTGRMGLPPTAQYGVWKHAQPMATVEEITAESRLLRAYDVMATMYVVDRASATSTAQITSAQPTGSAPASSVDDLRNAGLQVMVDVWPLVEPETSAFEEAAARKLLVADSVGAPLLVPAPSAMSRPDTSRSLPGSTAVAVVDFTHPEAASWWKDQMVSLYRADVNGVVLNEAALPDSGRYHTGEAARSVWHRWRTRYVNATREAFTDAGVKHPVIVGRAVDDRASRGLTLVQSTGWTADFDSTTGLPAAVTAAQTAGFAGVPIWTAAPTTDTASVQRDAFARWVQFRAFTPSFHLGAPSRVESWLSDPEMARIIRRYTRLHHTFSTYLWRQYKEAVATGRPVMRPLMLEVPRSARRTDRADQYFLGSDLLVAPVVDSTAARTVYLPPGQWMDFWSQEVYSGDIELRVEAPLDQIPVFVRYSREALSSLYRPVYKRQITGLATFLDERSLTEHAPPVATPGADDAAPDSSEADSTVASPAGPGVSLADSTGEESARPVIAADAAPMADTAASDTAFVVPEEDLPSGPGSIVEVLDNAPGARARVSDLSAFRAKLEEARLDVIYRQREGVMAPVAARSLIERIEDLDRTVRAMIRIIEG
ncbi:TIM-barrel domain-containing protein [Longibacter sp.]|uniref:TIM-barrel domain-containing protein n=1 Tax=Longibacter sp. TaxID=2045415 RepID=UPI003EBE8D2E